MQPKSILRAFQHYGLEPDFVDPPQGGYRNKVYRAQLGNQNAANLIVYKNEQDMLSKISDANRLSNFLHSRGLAVRHTLDSRVLKLKGPHVTQYAGLYNYLPGATISWEAYSRDHLKVLGKAMANIHSQAASLRHKNEPKIIDICSNQNRQMQKYFSDPNVVDALAEKLRLNIPQLTLHRLPALTTTHSAKEQLLHMDFVRGNILFQPATNNDDVWTVGKVHISGIIDFEKVAYGPTVFDITRTMAFLLVDCRGKTPQQIYKYFLYSGYQKRGLGQKPNRVELDNLIQYFLLYDFYKFLKHNPYQSLPQNLHFRKTVAILLRKGLVIKI